MMTKMIRDNGYIAGSLFCLLLLTISLPVYAANRNVTHIKSSIDGNVVVAVHSYAGERDKVRSPKNMRFAIPVGVMIQNRSDETIGIEDLQINESNKYRIWIDRLSPYIERTFGAIMETRAFEHDAADLKAELCNSAGGCKETDRLTVNEIFHAPWIKPGETYYGIIYFETRKGRFTPQKLWSIDDLVLTVPVLRKDLTRAYSINVSISGNKDLEAKADDIMKEESRSNGHGDPFAEIYVGPSNERPGNVALYDATKQMDECAAKGIGEVKSKMSRPYGYYASVEIQFNKAGEYISHSVNKTGFKQLDKVAEKIAKNMKDCKIADLSGNGASGNDTPYLKYEIIVGDTVAYAMDSYERDTTQSIERK